MNRRILLSLVTLLFTLFISSAVHAQPKDAGQSVFTLTTFRADGTILASSHGVLVGENGEAVSPWKPFVGAQRAIVIDAQGRQHDVEVMLGANELYDICRFKVCNDDASLPKASVLNRQLPDDGDKLFIVGYSVKKPVIKALKLNRVEKFMDKYAYCVFDGKYAENLTGCPVINSSGQVVGIMQMSAVNNEFHSTDAAFTETFSINALTINDALLRQTAIRVALPSKVEDARVTLMMAAQRDSLTQACYYADFIKAFPRATDGYISKAQQQLENADFSGVDKTMQEALTKVDGREEIFYNYARLVYHKLAYSPDTLYTSWNLPFALTTVQQAIDINPLPLYQHLKAQITYAQGNYQEAYDQFMALTKTNMHGGEVFYEAAQCKQHLKAPFAEVMTLLDSAVQAQPKALSANYYLARGRAWQGAGEYRKAMIDYCIYDTLVAGRGTHQFYYMKFLVEKEIRLYKQALNDIAHAVVLARTEPTYYAEMASLQLRVNQLDDAIHTCDLGLKVTDEYADLYIIKGIALCEQKKKDEGIAVLQKAQQLGDERAPQLLKKYK